MFVACGDVQNAVRMGPVLLMEVGMNWSWKVRFEAIGIYDLLGRGYRIMSVLFGCKERN